MADSAQQQTEFTILHAAITDPAAMTKLRRENIDADYFAWKPEGKPKSATNWLFQLASSYHQKSGGSLLTSNVVAMEMINHGMKEEERAKMLLFWEEIRDTEYDPNELHMHVEQLRQNRFARILKAMNVTTYDTFATKGKTEALVEVAKYAADLDRTAKGADAASSLARVDGAGGEWAEEYRRRRDDPKAWKCRTGLSTLDTATMGFRPQQIVSVLTPSSGGKSLILLDWAIEAMEQGLNVLLVSFEVDRWTCQMRMNAHLSGVDYSEIKGEKLSDPQIDMISAAMKSHDDRGAFIIDDSPMDCTVERLEERLRELGNEGQQPQVLVIDYLGLTTMRSAPRTAKKHEVQALVMMQLMRIARQYDVLIYTAAQFNRAAISENRQAKKGGTSFSIGQDGAAGSQELINGSNYVFGIESDREACTMVFHGVKMRDGAFEPFTVAVDPQHYRLSDCHHDAIHATDGYGPIEREERNDWSFGMGDE